MPPENPLPSSEGGTFGPGHRISGILKLTCLNNTFAEIAREHARQLDLPNSEDLNCVKPNARAETIQNPSDFVKKLLGDDYGNGPINNMAITLIDPDTEHNIRALKTYPPSFPLLQFVLTGRIYTVADPDFYSWYTHGVLELKKPLNDIRCKKTPEASLYLYLISENKAKELLSPAPHYSYPD